MIALGHGKDHEGGGFIRRLVGFSAAGGMIYTIPVAILGGDILTWLVRQLKKA